MIEFWAGTVLGVAIWSVLSMMKELWRIWMMDKQNDRKNPNDRAYENEKD